MDINMCFVIQPFDNGKFDKRYEESFSPAIKKANLEPYRVDKDLGTQIPINAIDEKMKQSSIVFADITLDNPNVWFEVGLAIAYGKKIVLVCSSERRDKFPFDIQHRTVVEYDTSSRGDYEKMERDITEKLKSLMLRKEMTAKPESETGILPEKDVSDEALILFGIIGKQIDSFEGAVSYGQVSSEMASIGYNNLAVNLAIWELEVKKYIVSGEECDWSNNNYRALKVTEEGAHWLEKNKTRFNLSYLPIEEKTKPFATDDIPF